MHRLLLCCVLLVGCSATGQQVVNAPPKGTQVETGAIALHVKGLGCPLCATNVKKSLERLPEVREASVDLGKGIVTVKCTNIDDSRLQKAVADAGFTLTNVERI